jgi:hypothetical protein
VVAAVGIVFVRYDGEIRMAGTVPLLRHLAHPCNTLAQVAKLMNVSRSTISRLVERAGGEAKVAVAAE